MGSFRFRIFDFLRCAATGTGGRSGGRPAIFDPLATFDGAETGGGNSSFTKAENFLIRLGMDYSILYCGTTEERVNSHIPRVAVLVVAVSGWSVN